MTLRDSANYAQQFGSLLIAFLGILFFYKRSVPIKILALYGINSFVFQMAGNLIIYYKIKGIININGNLYVLSELLILLSFFFILFDSSYYKRIIIGCALICVTAYFILIQDQWTIFNGQVRTMRDIVIIVCSLIYFYILLNKLPSIQLTSYPLFWITTGFLLLFAGTFTLSLTTDYWVHVLETTDSFWILRNFFRFLCCLVVSYGLLLDFEQIKASKILNSE